MSILSSRSAPPSSRSAPLSAPPAAEAVPHDSIITKEDFGAARTNKSDAARDGELEWVKEQEGCVGGWGKRGKTL